MTKTQQEWWNEGGTLYQRGRDDEAIKAYEQAIQLSPNKAAAYYDLCEALHALTQDQAARQAREEESHAAEPEGQTDGASDGLEASLQQSGARNGAIIEILRVEAELLGLSPGQLEQLGDDAAYRQQVLEDARASAEEKLLAARCGVLVDVSRQWLAAKDYLDQTRSALKWAKALVEMEDALHRQHQAPGQESAGHQGHEPQAAPRPAPVEQQRDEVTKQQKNAIGAVLVEAASLGVPREQLEDDASRRQMLERLDTPEEEKRLVARYRLLVEAGDFAFLAARLIGRARSALRQAEAGMQRQDELGQENEQNPQAPDLCGDGTPDQPGTPLLEEPLTIVGLWHMLQRNQERAHVRLVERAVALGMSAADLGDQARLEQRPGEPQPSEAVSRLFASLKRLDEAAYFLTQAGGALVELEEVRRQHAPRRQRAVIGQIIAALKRADELLEELPREKGEEQAAAGLEQMAADPALRPASLEALSTHENPAVRRAVASNPHTPVSCLARLAGEFLDEVLTNPAIAHMQPDDPANDTFLRGMSEQQWLHLLRSEHIPLHWLRRARAMSGAVADAALLHVRQENDAENLIYGTPLIIRSITYDDDDVQPAAAPSPLAAVHGFRRLVNPQPYEMSEDTYENRIRLATADFMARYWAARHENAPGWLLLRLAREPEHPIRKVVAGNLRTPQEVLLTLAADPEPAVRRAAAGNPHLPSDVLRKLATDSDSGMRARVAAHRQTPEDVLSQLADDPNVRVCEGLAFNPRTPADALRRVLGHDIHVTVTMQVASHPQAPEDILRELAAKYGEDYGGYNFWASIRARVAQNPYTPLDVLHHLAADHDPTVREAAAKNPRAPQDMLEQLAADPEAIVRAGVMKNPHAPERLLGKLAADPSWRVRAAIAQHTHMPEAAWLALAADPDNRVQEALVNNPHLPIEALRKIASSTSLMHHLREKAAQELARLEASEKLLQALLVDFRQSGGTRPSQAGEEALSVLAADASQKKRAIAAWHPALPPKALARLADDTEPEIRAIIAWHPALSSETLERLALDFAWIVRMSVALRPDLPPALSAQLLRDPHESVQAAARALHPGAPGEHLALASEQGAEPAASPAPLWADQEDWELRWQLHLDLEELLSQPFARFIRPPGQFQEDAPSIFSRAMPDSLRAVLLHRTLCHYWTREGITNFKYLLRMRELSPGWLACLAATPFWEQRCLVALNPATPRYLLERLAHDGNRYVRAAARLYLEGPQVETLWPITWSVSPKPQ